MAKVILTLEDQPDGTVEMKACFEGGYDKTSHAHGQAALLIGVIDDRAEEIKAAPERAGE